MEQKKKRNYGKMTAEELSTAVNLVRSENSGVFGVKDIRSAFKDLGVPMYSEFATTLVQQGVLVQAGLTYQDGFSWSSTEPIHMNKVVELMTITRKKVAAQARKYSQKKKAIQQGTWVEPVKQPKETTEIEQYLKKFQFMNTRNLYQLIRQLISCLLRMGIEFLNLSLYMRK